MKNMFTCRNLICPNWNSGTGTCGRDRPVEINASGMCFWFAVWKMRQDMDLDEICGR